MASELIAIVSFSIFLFNISITKETTADTAATEVNIINISQGLGFSHFNKVLEIQLVSYLSGGIKLCGLGLKSYFRRFIGGQRGRST